MVKSLQQFPAKRGLKLVSLAPSNLALLVLFLLISMFTTAADTDGDGIPDSAGWAQMGASINSGPLNHL